MLRAHRRLPRVVVMPLPLLCLAGAIIPYAADTASAAPISIAKSSRPTAVIVVPTDAPNPVVFAGEELKHFLDRMTGGDFRVVQQLPGEVLRREADRGRVRVGVIGCPGEFV